jgi:hypothetical protein
MKRFLTEVWQTFAWNHWADISEYSLGKALGFFSRILLLAFLLMLLLMIPALIKLPGVISEQLAKFDTLRLSSNVTMSSPVKLPRSDPLLILDTTGAYTALSSERVLITNDKIFYRPFFTTYDVNTEDLKDLKNNRDDVKAFLAMLAFFLLPSVLVYAYVFIWLKYFLLILALSIILFVVLDLTHWRRTWKELFVISCYSSTLPVLAEVIISAVNAHWLIPVLNVFGLVKLYLIPAVVLAVIATGASLCVFYNKKEEK